MIEKFILEVSYLMNGVIIYFDYLFDEVGYEWMMKVVDIGLFFYDGCIYFVWWVGIFGEFLSFGVFVIVFVGSWFFN